MKEIKIDLNTSGGRLDKLVMAYLDKAPKGFVFKMLRKKNIVLNDKKANGNELLKPGDSVKIYFSDETINKFHSARSDEFDEASAAQFLNYVRYEDENIIIIDKPAGILSQKAAADDISINELMVEYLKKEALEERTSNDGVEFKPGISNRLDRNTSGLMLAGKNPNAVRELNNAVKERKLSKHYYCIVCGKAQFDGTKRVENYLLKDEKENVSEIFEKIPQSSSNKESDYEKIITEFETIAASEHCSILKVGLITGKSHQIRAQIAKLGYPIIGDPKYGNKGTNEKFKKSYGVERQLLHASEVKFENMGGILAYLNNMTFKANLPNDFRAVMKGENIWLPGEAEA